MRSVTPHGGYIGARVDDLRVAVGILRAATAAGVIIVTRLVEPRALWTTVTAAAAAAATARPLSAAIVSLRRPPPSHRAGRRSRRCLDMRPIERPKRRCKRDAGCC
ncbi:unnamed protein product [Ectocarpus fasciculatus]